jgi:hypothetical protein
MKISFGEFRIFCCNMTTRGGFLLCDTSSDYWRVQADVGCCSPYGTFEDGSPITIGLGNMSLTRWPGQPHCRSASQAEEKSTCHINGYGFERGVASLSFWNTGPSAVALYLALVVASMQPSAREIWCDTLDSTVLRRQVVSGLE